MNITTTENIKEIAGQLLFVPDENFLTTIDLNS
jgi:hypothetical protein